MKEIKEANAVEGAQQQIYALLKEQAFSAKCLNKIKDFTKAEEVCGDVIEFVKEQEEEEVQTYWKFAVKAYYIKAKNMMNVMEFKAAKTILEEQAKPLLKKLIEKF